jgi:thiamine kinase-like enzyme
MSLNPVQQIAEKLLPYPIISIGGISGGRNSQVYKVACADNKNYALKIYFKHETDKRDRLGAEFSSFRFLWDHGVRNIPEAVIADHKNCCAVYGYIEGKRIINEDINNKDIDQITSFLNTLESLKGQADCWKFNAASEACFSIRAILENVQIRLSALFKNYENNADLYDFIENHFNPLNNDITKWCYVKLKEYNLSFNEELSIAERTLSPSDFGFHNALRAANGNLFFLDFEYFGWDDPAKMVVDVLLHPGMTLSVSQKKRFVHGIMEHFHQYPNLSERIEIAYPLFGLKWCLILLNEFLPERLLLRKFSGMNTDDRHALQTNQLNKASSLLHKIFAEYDEFPYFN